eukprot:gene26387-17481_t
MEVGSGSKRSKEKKEKKEGKKEEKKAKKEEKKKKKRRRREQSSPSSSPPSSAPSSPPSPSSRLVDSYLQIMKYSMKQGRASRLDRILKTLPKDEVKTLLRMHDSSGKTPLHQASRIGNIEVVTVLLRNGANAGVQDSEGNSPAHLAASNGHLLSLTQLLPPVLLATAPNIGFTPECKPLGANQETQNCLVGGARKLAVPRNTPVPAPFINWTPAD